MSRALKPGDRVSWTRTKKAGSGYRFCTCRGYLVLIDGEMARVIDRGRYFNIPLERLRHANQRTALTEAFMGLEASQS